MTKEEFEKLRDEALRARASEYDEHCYSERNQREFGKGFDKAYQFIERLERENKVLRSAVINVGVAIERISVREKTNIEEYVYELCSDSVTQADRIRRGEG